MVAWYGPSQANQRHPAVALAQRFSLLLLFFFLTSYLFFFPLIKIQKLREAPELTDKQSTIVPE